MVFGKKEVVDDVEKSKIITRGNAEGSGIYSCTSGSHAGEPFTCSSADKEAIAKHEREDKHYRQGTAPCAICEQPINMNEILTLAGRKPIHPDCQQPVEEL
jgi:hypothetical protein